MERKITLLRLSKINRGLLNCAMVLSHLVKITGLIQILCNLSINLLYTVFIIATQVWPTGHMPRHLPFHLILLLCMIPGYRSLLPINDKYLKVLLLLFNLGITALVWVIFANVVKNYGPHVF